MNKFIAIILVAALGACSKSDPTPPAASAAPARKLTADDLKKMQADANKEMDESMRKTEEEMRKKKAAQANKEAAHAQK